MDIIFKLSTINSNCNAKANDENVCLKALFPLLLCVRENKHTKDLFRINLHKTWCYFCEFYFIFVGKKSSSIKGDDV